MSKRIYLSPPHVGALERELLLEAFDSNWIAPLGPHVDAFERELARYVGLEHCAALSSGTAALHLALLLLGVGRGDEVFVSTFTFSATANAVTYVGATPVFIDSDMASWNMDPGLLEQALEDAAKRGRLPRAVIVVDLYGQCANFDPILSACARFDVPVIEDAAEALGARYKGRRAGTFGALSILSFNGNKIITTSGGGALLSNDGPAVRRARHLATQAREPMPHYEHIDIGYNYRLSNLLAALGRAQLQSLDDRVAARRRNFERYRSLLGGLPGIAFMPEPEGFESTRWLTCITVDPEELGSDRESIRRALEESDIEARPAWKPMHLQPAFRHCYAVGGGVSESIFEKGLCLPSGSSLTQDEQQRVAESIISSTAAMKR